jgi:hypothetical protein
MSSLRAQLYSDITHMQMRALSVYVHKFQSVPNQSIHISLRIFEIIFRLPKQETLQKYSLGLTKGL